jgi:fibronectin-binding autotransporter adhesin
VTFGDEMLFNGQTTGPVVATQNGGSQANGAGTGLPYGLRIHLSSSQTSPVTIYSPVSVSGGLRMNYILIDAGAAAFNLGDHGNNCLDILSGVLNGQVFGFTNNSTTPASINETVRWRMGGAGAHPHIFAGTGDWILNNHMRSANSSAIIVQKFGPGTITWTGTNNPNSNFPDQLGSPVTIGGGTMIWKTSDLVGGSIAGNPNIINNATWEYDANDGGTCLVAGTISGSGAFQMVSGICTFQGANTFTGPINLTGGTLIANSTENVGVSGPLGQGGTISFSGGTLAWSPANAFDYSARFSTAPSQVYNIDTGGASPTFATGLSSSGGSLNKLGGGTLTLAAPSTYTGPTTIAGGGEIVFQSTKAGTANITVADTGALGVFENGSPITPATLSLGTTTGVTLELNNVTNHAVATLAPNTLVAAGTVTINVNSGRFFSIGETFPLLKWTSGTAPVTALAFLAGAGGHLATNGNEIDLVIDDPPFIWTGQNSAVWDSSTTNWTRSGIPVAWDNSGIHYALFDDSSTVTNLTVSGLIAATNLTINSSSAYAITNSPGNAIHGPGSLDKTGPGSLILPGGANDYTGITTLGGGVSLANVLANGGSASDIGAAGSAAGNILFHGGTLQYIGAGVSINRLFSVGPGGGTIDNEGGGALVFNNTGSLGMSGNGPRTLTLTGTGTSGATLACVIANHPAGTSLAKNGAGLWILTGTNTYAGGTALLQGTLQVGAGGTGGTLGNGNITTVSGTIIDFERTGTVTVPGAINGACSVTSGGSGTVILANNNGFTGGTTINAGTLQVGNGGGTGALFVIGPIVNNSLLVFNTAGSFTYQAAGAISGTGNVIFQGGGTIKAIGPNSYTGWTRIDAGTTFFCREGQDGLLASSVVTNNGTLRMVSQDALFAYTGPILGSGKVQVGANAVNFGVMTLSGTNTYTGGTFIGGNQLVLGDGSAGSGAIAGIVQFVNNFTVGQDSPRTLTFNRSDDFTFGGTITTNFAAPQNNLGIVQQNGTGRLTLTGNNKYGSGTVINSGSIIVGNGGTLGFGGVTDNSALVFNTTGNVTVPGAIAGTGSVTLLGSGRITLPAANNTLLGPTTVSNGTLVVGSMGGGDLSVEGGTVIVGGTGVIGNANVNNMNIDSGTVVASLNRAASPSRTTYTVAGTLTHTGGTLKLYIAGPALQVGDKFTIFSQPVPGGASMPIISPGCTVSNSLASDGSVVVTSAQPLPSITASISGTNLTLSWPASWTGGVVLQNQTNRLNQGLRLLPSSWTTIPGTDLGNTYVSSINNSNGCVFFRFALP